MPLPEGVPSKTLVFGRYSGVLGNNKGGKISVGFEDAMLHTPTGEVVVAGMETVDIQEDTGIGQIAVPVTVTDQLVARWRETNAYHNQRLKVVVEVPGYMPGAVYVEITSDAPDLIDFDQMSKFATSTGIEVVAQGSVRSVAGLVGHVAAADLAPKLDPYMDGVTEAELEPPVDLVILFENALEGA